MSIGSKVVITSLVGQNATTGLAVPTDCRDVARSGLLLQSRLFRAARDVLELENFSAAAESILYKNVKCQVSSAWCHYSRLYN